jgi:hypothetical protein
LDEIVTIFAQQIVYPNTTTACASKQRDNATKANAYGVAKCDTKAHCLLIGLQYAMPSVLPIRITLTRQGAPLVLSVRTNGIGVKAGIGVLALVATAPTPTST